jgi:predicted ABC-type ATPase
VPSQEDSVAAPDDPRDAPATAAFPELAAKLADLPAGHPSRPDYVATVRERDAEYADHITAVKEVVTDANARGQTTRALHSIDGRGEVWKTDRRAEHDKIIHDLYAAAAAVPCDGKAIIVGGLPGAGKTTVVREHLGADRADWLVINPDVIKHELAARELVPRLEQLTPMEATELAHEESSHIAKRLAGRALAEHKNVVWDITMASGRSTAERIDQLRDAGYTRVDGIFVEVPIETSLERVASRHRKDDDRYRATGGGLGGHFVPDQVIEAQADQQWGSANRRSFEQLKDRFDSWYYYDNSGARPMLKDQFPARRDDRDQRR